MPFGKQPKVNLSPASSLKDKAGLTAGPINRKALQKNSPDPAHIYLALSPCYCNCLDKSTELKIMAQKAEFVVMTSGR